MRIHKKTSQQNTAESPFLSLLMMVVIKMELPNLPYVKVTESNKPLLFGESTMSKFYFQKVVGRQL